MNGTFQTTKKVRRVMAAVLCVALMAAFGGCASFFDKEYVVVSDHVDDYMLPDEDNYSPSVRNYAGMRNAVMSMVESGTESIVFTTENYNGDAKEDISRACLEVTRETPLGVYAVEYMTHFCTQILTYYRIEVLVTYKHTAEEIDSIVRLSGENELKDSVIADVMDFREKATYSFVGSSLSEDELRESVVEEYRNNPLVIPELPEMSFVVYPNEEAVQKIVEISYRYPSAPGEHTLRSSAVLSHAGSLMYDYPSVSGPFDVYKAMSGGCRYSETAGNTVYDAIVSGEADSEGIAMGFKFLCELMGIECSVVEGRRNSEPYYWNMIRIDGELYHSDISECLASGPEEAFMLRDSDMWGRYWWDTDKYSPCTGTKTFSDIFGAAPAAEEPQP